MLLLGKVLNQMFQSTLFHAASVIASGQTSQQTTPPMGPPRPHRSAEEPMFCGPSSRQTPQQMTEM